MSTTIVFRCCKKCGSAEDVNVHQPYCPDCGTSYLEQAEARILELESFDVKKEIALSRMTLALNKELIGRITKAKAITNNATCACRICKNSILAALEGKG